jgi:hypothetical protein
MESEGKTAEVAVVCLEVLFQHIRVWKGRWKPQTENFITSCTLISSRLMSEPDTSRIESRNAYPLTERHSRVGKLFLRNLEISSSNLGLEAAYPNRDFRDLLQVHCGRLPHIRHSLQFIIC